MGEEVTSAADGSRLSMTFVEDGLRADVSNWKFATFAMALVSGVLFVCGATQALHYDYSMTMAERDRDRAMTEARSWEESATFWRERTVVRFGSGFYASRRCE